MSPKRPIWDAGIVPDEEDLYDLVCASCGEELYEDNTKFFLGIGFCYDCAYMTKRFCEEPEAAEPSEALKLLRRHMRGLRNNG